MKPRFVIVSDRSLASADTRSRRSALLYAELARTFDVIAVVRTDGGTAREDVELAPGFVERRIPRTPAEAEWQQIARSRYGADGGDDALWFERTTALNPAFIAALRSALDGAAAAACVRPYAYAPLRALTGLPIVYDALELEYQRRVASSAGAPNRVDLLEQVAAAERTCAAGADLVLTGDPVGARLAAAMYALPAERVLALAPVYDGGLASPRSHAERAARKAATNLRDRTIALFVGTATPANVADAAALFGVAAHVPEVLFLIAGRVGEIFPSVARPANVQFTGVLDDATLAVLLDAADVVVHASAGRTRIARKVLDGAAHGAPLLLTPNAAGSVFADGVAADVAELGMWPARLRALGAEPARGERHAHAARVSAALACPASAAVRPLLAALDARIIGVPA